jgi:hypothetical protein
MACHQNTVDHALLQLPKALYEFFHLHDRCLVCCIVCSWSMLMEEQPVQVIRRMGAWLAVVHTVGVAGVVHTVH